MIPQIGPGVKPLVAAILRHVPTSAVGSRTGTLVPTRSQPSVLRFCCSFVPHNTPQVNQP
jgi:hypothetical protein